MCLSLRSLHTFEDVDQPQINSVAVQEWSQIIPITKKCILPRKKWTMGGRRPVLSFKFYKGGGQWRRVSLGRLGFSGRESRW
jgi:hypothetical protein